MLKKWRESYLKTRLDIELSGKGNRWEFDQKRLFGHTEYIAKVCIDLCKMIEVLQDFHNIFGPYLKSIINDPAQIDAVVKRVNTLLTPIQEADFDIFDMFNMENWKVMTEWFYEEVLYLEDQAKFYIDECFMVLISAEDSLQMLVKFKDLKTRPAIQQQLLRKFDTIMQQFSKEIGHVENIFHRGKRYPPLLTYHPPMAGAIFWVRQLFHRLRRPVLMFQQVSELKHNELKLIAFNQYHDVARQLKEFEETKFNMWLEKAQMMVTTTMKKSVLRIIRIERDFRTALTFPEQNAKDLTKIKNTLSVPGTVREFMYPKHNIISMESITSAPHKISVIQTRSDVKDVKKVSKSLNQSAVFSDKQDVRCAKTIDFMSNAILIECQLRFQLNFNWEMFEVIREAELMEQLGFELPMILRDIGVQKNRLRADMYAIEKVVDRYNSMLETLEKADVQLLKHTLQDVEKHIQPGVTRFNWNSLSILNYASVCNTMLKNLKSVIDQVNQMKKDIESRIESNLKSYYLFSLRKKIIELNILLPCKV